MMFYTGKHSINRLLVQQATGFDTTFFYYAWPKSATNRLTEIHALITLWHRGGKEAVDFSWFSLLVGSRTGNVLSSWSIAFTSLG